MLLVPFNFDPSANDFGNTGSSYTPAAGKYAIVTVTMTVDAYGEAGFSTFANLGVIFATSSADSATIKIEVATGETVAATATAASSTTGSVASGSTSSTSIASVTVGGNKVAEIKATGTAGHSHGSSATSTVSGNADVNFHVAEYNVIS